MPRIRKKDSFLVLVAGLFLAALVLVFTPWSMNGGARMWWYPGMDMALLFLALIGASLEIVKPHPKQERVFWIFFGLALGFLFITRGSVLFVEISEMGGLARDLGLVLFYLMIFLGLISRPEKPVSNALLFFHQWLHRAGFLLFTFGLAAYFLLIPIAKNKGTDLANNMALVLAIIANAALMVGFGWLARGTRTYKWRKVYVLLCLSFGLLLLQEVVKGVPIWASIPFAVLVFVTRIGNGHRPEIALVTAPPKSRSSLIEEPLSLVWVSAFFFPVLHLSLSRLTVMDPPPQSAHEAVVLLCMVGLGGLGLWQSRIQKKIQRTNLRREREMARLKESRSDLENRMEVRMRQLSVAKSSLRRQIAKSQELEETLRKNEERFSVLVETMNEGMVMIDENLGITYANQAFCRMLGYSRAELAGRGVIEFFDPENLATFENEREKRKQGDEHPFEIVWQAKDGGEVPTIMSPRIIRDEMGNLKGSFSVVTDITMLKKAESEMRFLAQNDPLTKLPNRTLLRERLDRAIERAGHEGGKLAVLYLDLDRFKRVNDSLGHGIGDRVLVAIAKRLVACVKERDTVARLSGNEFAVVIRDVDKSMEIVAPVEKILATISEPLQLDNYEVTVTASIGISMFPSDGGGAEDLLKNANAAMSYVKTLGRNNYQFYTEEMSRAALERLTLENQLRIALDREEFVLFYQPKVDLRDGRITGVEALVRWYHSEKGLLSPDRFIPIAEDSGLIVPLGEWVLETACRQAKAWQDEGLMPISMAVNLSALQFRSENLPAKVLSALSKADLDPRYLELEITESLAMEDAEMTIGILGHLKTLGLRIAIDDFGTGYSSLNYLKRFPIDTLKIDGCFIKDVLTNTEDAAIVSAVIALGHGMRLQIIAEGVETKGQVGMLTGQGCDQIQGFIISQPVTAERLRDLVRKKSLMPL